MKFQILNRKTAKKYSMTQHETTSIIISIFSTDDKPLCIKKTETNNIRAYLPICFDDVGEGCHGCMTEQDAHKISVFLKVNQGTYDKLIVHCDAGISRSAGICAAIEKYMTGSDMRVFGNPFYKPNMHCYKLMLKELFN